MRIALPVVGAVVGFIVGGGPQGAYYGWMAGSIVAGLIGTQTRRSVRVNETGAQTTTEGALRAIVFGAAPVTGNLIDTGPIRIVETTEEAKGGSGPSQTTKQYFRTYAIRVCEGPIAAYLVIKRDGMVIYDARPGSNFAADNAKLIERTEFYYGDETQLPSTGLEIVHGVGNVPTYRGSAYVVFNNDELTNRQGSVPQYEFVVASAGTADITDLTPLTSVSVAGTFGGGTFTEFAQDATFDTVGAGGITGSAFLAYFNFDANLGGGPYVVNLSVRVGSTIVWTRELTVPIAGNTSAAVQINHAPDATEFSLSWVGAFTGNFGTTMQGLQGVDPYAPLRPGVLLVEPEEADFGVVQNTTTFGAAQYSLSWRTDLEYNPGTFTPAAVVLGDIVEDIHARCNASVPDVTELDDEVAGIVLGSAEYSGADAIETLRAPYTYDRAEYDGQIHYRRRGADSVATITFDDLVEVPDESQREALPDYPRKLHLGYQASQVNYELAQATSDRYSTDVRVNGEQSVQVPVVLDAAGAANIVARLHKVAWADAEGEIKFSLPLEWIGLTASECVNLDLRDRVRRLRIEKIEDSPGVRALTCRMDRQTAYLSTAPSFIPLPIPPAPPSTVPGDTILAMLDISALRDVDDILLQYVAVTGEAAAWRGAQVQRSLDEGATFTPVQTISSAAVIGTLVDAVASASEHYTDTTNTVRVQLLRDGQALTSISDLAFEQYGGAFALEKADGSWEVMQYLDATDEGDGVFLLSTLHRGLGNSTPAVHVNGAVFVLLAGVRAQAAESAWLGADLTHRAPSIGQSPEDAAEQTATFVGRSQTEWPVTALDLERDGSDVLTATWVPRHRLGSDVAPIASVNFEGYRVTLDDGVLDEVVFDVTTATFTYDASALATPVDVTIQALNRFTGAGPATTDSI